MKENYIYPKHDELKDLLIITAILAILFSLTYSKFSESKIEIIPNFILIFIFLIILLLTRLIFMKFIAYKLGLEISLKKYYFNKYFIRPYDSISHLIPSLPKGISSVFLSILIYILTIGIIVFPSLSSFSVKKIPHLYLGSKLRFEDVEDSIGITKYRYSLILFYGALYYFLFAFLYKILSVLLNFEFFSVFIFILYWIAIFSTLPIPLTEGWDLFSSNHFAWLSAISILIFSLFILLIFDNLFLIIFTTFIAIITIFVTVAWKKLMK